MQAKLLTPSTRFLIGVCLTGMTALAAEVQLTGDRLPSARGDLVIHPINHATLALSWNNLVIYADPVGGAKRYQNLPRADLVLLTDIHADHLNVDTLKAVTTEKSSLVAPEAVAKQLPADLKARTTVLSNGESKVVSSIKIEALPMYNTTPSNVQYHPGTQTVSSQRPGQWLHLESRGKARLPQR